MNTYRSGIWNRYWHDYRAILFMLVLMMGFRSAWADWVRVPSGSMNPTILEGDLLLVNKHVYGIRLPFTRTRLTPGADPVRGEIIVFDSPADGRSLVKRVVAVPGDRVELDGETLIVNGSRSVYSAGHSDRIGQLLAATREQNPQVLRESGPLGSHDILILPDGMGHISVSSTIVPAGMYFVLGDNRDNSADSRYIGFVPRANIVGRARTVAVSFDPDRHFLPRQRRLFAPLI